MTFSWDKGTLVDTTKKAPESTTEGFSWDKGKIIEEGESDRQKFLDLPFEERARISRELGQEASRQAEAAIGTGAIPGLHHHVERGRAAGYIPPSLNPTAEAVGEFAGASAPIGLIGKGVNLATNPYLAGVRGGPLIQAGLTGTSYKAAETLLGEGRLPETPEAAGEAALFAAGHGVASGLGKLYSKAKGLFQAKPKPPTSQQLIQGTISQGGEAPPQSMFLKAKEAQELLQEAEIAARPPEPPPPPPPPGPFQQIKIGQETQARSLKGRVTPQESKQLGITVPVTPKNPTTEQAVLGNFKHEIHNTTKAGEATKNVIRDSDKKAYQKVNEAYKESRELNRVQNDIFPEVVNDFMNIVEDINQIKDPSTIQDRFRTSLKKLVSGLAEVNSDGLITGYKPMNNQQLIDQIQSWRQIVDFDFPHGDAKNIYKRGIDILQNAVLQSAERGGSQEAVDALKKAQGLYKEWTKTYNNDYINPFRDESNLDFSKNFNKLKDFDNFNVAKNILEKTPEGKVILEGVQREIVDARLKKFFDNPRAFTSREFQRELKELEAVLSPEQISSIKKSFEQKFKHKVKNQTPEKIEGTPKNLEKAVEKYTGKNPEAIEKLMNSRSGIRQLRDDLGKTEKTKEIFTDLSKQKVRNLLEGIETGKDLHKVVSKYSNREIFEELLGEEAVKDLIKISEEVGEKEISDSKYSKLWITLFKKGLYTAKLGPLGLLIK